MADYYNSIITSYNTDENGNIVPKLIQNENIKVLFNGVALLDEIPYKPYSVYISGYTEVSSGMALTSTQFYVEYNGAGARKVHFAVSEIGKHLTVTYKGLGKNCIIAANIATEYTEDGDIVQSLADYIDQYVEVMDAHRIHSQVIKYTATTSITTIPYASITGLTWNPAYDNFQIVYGGALLIEDENYSKDDTGITLSEPLNIGESIFFTVFRGLLVDVPAPSSDGSLLLNGSVAKFKLEQSVQDKIDAVPVLQSDVSEIFDKLENIATIDVEKIGISNLQSEINALTGNFNILFPEGTFQMPNITISNKNNITIQGKKGTILQSDTDVFTFSNCNNIKVDSFDLQNITTPYLFDRWSDGYGYQPTVNDPEWSSLTTEQQNQNINVGIIFNTCKNIEVSRITGNFVAIIATDCSSINIHDNNYRAGKNFAGGILVWKSSIDSVVENVSIHNNIVKYSSYSGICVAGTRNASILGNKVIKCGESGIKTYQNVSGGVDLRCQYVVISENVVDNCRYDGIDICTTYPVDDSYSAHSIVANNISRNNYFTGLTGSGKFFTISNNQFENNRLYGATAVVSCSVITNNIFTNNNTSNNNYHEANVNGTNNVISDNLAYRSSSYTGYGFYVDAGNQYSNNKTVNCSNYVKSSNIENGTSGTTINDGTVSGDSYNLDIKVRSTALQNPVTRIVGNLDSGVSGSEKGGCKIQVANNGVLETAFNVTCDKAVVLGVNGTSNDYMHGKSVRFEVNESTNQLNVIVKYSDGTIKTTALSLT